MPRARERRPGGAARRDVGSRPTRPAESGASDLAWLPWAFLALAAVLRFAWPSPLPRTPDENLFTNYARDVATHGPAAVARFVAWCSDHPDRGMFPWPQRVGYVWISGAVLAIARSPSVWLLIGLSSVASLLVMAMVGGAAKRDGDAVVATLAILFLAVSPLDFAIARRVWQDDVLAVFTTGLWIALAHAARRPASVRVSLPAFGLMALALLIKETALPVAATATLYLMWRSWRAGAGGGGVAVRAALGVGALGVAASVVTVAAGGPDAIRRTIALARIVNVPNEYMRTYQQGSLLYYAEGLLRLQPAGFLLVLLALAARLGRRMPGPEAERRDLEPLLDSATWLVLGHGIVSTFWPQKNMRFLSPTFAPAALLAAVLVRGALGEWKRRVAISHARWVVLGAIVLLGLMAVTDLALYHHWFVVRAVPDLATPWFRK